MLYGDEIVVMTDGLSVSPKAMEAIGIHHDSVCWGVWLWDPSPSEDKNERYRDAAPHLFISPFHPRSWPISVRLQVAIQDTDDHAKGTLSRATEVLSKLRAEILFTRATPTGHHHATWNAICENTPLRTLLRRCREKLTCSRSRAYIQGRVNWQRLAFSDPDSTSEYLSSNFDPGVHERILNAQSLGEKLRAITGGHAAAFCQKLKAQLFLAHLKGERKSKSKGFLHDKLFEPGKLFWNSEIVDEQYSAMRDFLKVNDTLEEISSEVEKATNRNRDKSGYTLFFNKLRDVWDFPKKYEAPAILTSGLPYLVHAWLFGDHVDEPVKFRFNAKRSILSPIHRKEYYLPIVDQFIHLPQKVVTSFHPEDCCMRACFPNRERLSKRIFMRVSYETTYKDPKPWLQEPFQQSSCGILTKILERLNEKKVELIRVSSQLSDRARYKDKGVISIAGFLPDSRRPENDAVEIGKSLSDLTASYTLKSQDHTTLGTLCGDQDPPGGARGIEKIESVSRVVDTDVSLDQFDQLFVSVRLQILHTKKLLNDKIKSCAAKRGFKAIILNEPVVRVPDKVRHTIRKSSALLQIIPILPDERSGKLERIEEVRLDWLLFEYGCAFANDIPIAICVDNINGGSLKQWETRLPTPKQTFFPFDSRCDTDEIIRSINEAVTWLRAEVSGNDFGS